MGEDDEELVSALDGLLLGCRGREDGCAGICFHKHRVRQAKVTRPIFWMSKNNSPAIPNIIKLIALSQRGLQCDCLMSHHITP